MAAKTKITGKQVLDELKSPALIVLGMIGGNLGGKLIDQALGVDDTSTEFQVKGLVKPIVQLTAGIGGSILLKDQNLKLIANGVAASGVASTVKVLLKKDMLAGFKGLGTAEALKNFRENLKIERYNPHLPELASTQVESLPIEVAPAGANDYTDYEEVDAVEIL
ncbi:MAG: hypothetical protein KKA07_07655 [Bacteroidetes bacterium]|nr:hypothetical protein [Bacteroidota bacterium]MBU1718937.1 hypothetical protein [Bacteroidota bacterium]